MCGFRGFFLEHLHEFEGRFLSDLCVNKMVHASSHNNYHSFWHLLRSQQLLGNNKSLKTNIKTLLSLPTVVSGNRPNFEGFRGFSSEKSDFRGFSMPSNSTFLFSRVFEGLYEPCFVYSKQ